MTKPLLILLTLFLFFPPVFAQVKQAEKEMAVYNFTEAVTLLHKALEKKNQEEVPKITELLAECYLKLNNWPQAKVWHKQAITLGKISSDNYFYLAQAYRNIGDYPEARRLFLICDSLEPDTHRGLHFAATCDSALLWLQQDPGFEVQNMVSLNSPQSEFGTVVMPSGILFTSDRILERGPGKRYGWTGNSYLRLFKAKPSSGKQDAFLPPEIYTELADQMWHDGPASFDSTFSEVFINRTLYYGDRGKKDPDRTRTHLLKIYFAIIEEGGWTKPQPFFLNNRNYSVGHPTLSPDGKRLFFVSDKPGGFGSTDIYVCYRNGKGWEAPVNLGPIVNTPGNEMFPFVTEQDELWFASDFHPGFGGLDLFVTRVKVENKMGTGKGIGKESKTGTTTQVGMGIGKWTTPHNPGHPLNSSFDDFSVWTDSTGNQGFFSSNRPGGLGSDDIYYFSKQAQSIELRAQLAVDSGQLAVGSRHSEDTSHRLPVTSHESLLLNLINLIPLRTSITTLTNGISAKMRNPLLTVLSEL
ncbi:MAG: PD40 domain-containing protein [Bacteroidia bacterium]|nr:PD40 domain-containing protein [Bacteroidia bacterium]